MKKLRVILAVFALAVVFISCSESDPCYTCDSVAGTTEVCEGYVVTYDQNGTEIQRLELSTSNKDYVEILETNPAFTCTKK